MNNPDIFHNRRELARMLARMHPDEKDELLAVWDRLEDGRPSSDYDQERSDKVLAAIRDAAIDRAVPTGKIHSLPLRTTWIGAAAAVIVAAIALWFFLTPVTRTADSGEILMVELPDGSSVELNHQASLSYPRFFRSSRTVSLDGEAFFEVTQGNKPFIAETFNARVTVLGTSFNIRSWRNSQFPPHTTVAVATGKVGLASLTRDVVLEIEAGDVRTIGADGSPTDSPADMEAATGWRTGELLYHDRPLGIVLEDVERRFGTEIQLEVDSLSRRRVNISFHNPDKAEMVVQTICGAYSLRYRRTATGFIIFE